MFRAISHSIALQFTAFVFAMLLITGCIFLGADLANSRRQMNGRLANTSQAVLNRVRAGSPIPTSLPPQLREQVRLVTALGDVLYAGAIFQDVPFSPAPGVHHFSVAEEQFAVMTLRVVQNGQLNGYLQIAEVDRVLLREIPERALLFLIVSISLSALTFGVGLFFARRSLTPAEQMLERLEQFTQDASHELRTPLAALNSSLDLALRTGKHHEGLLSAKDDIRQISGLVERLLELARLDRFTVQPGSFDMSALTDDTVERHRALAAEKKVELRAEVAPGVTLRGDPALTARVLGNLLGNAIKFSKPEGGTVTVHLDAKSLQVRDEGVGIAPEALPNVFDRFFQADGSRARGGFGLGLALAKRIADVHGWKMEAESVPSKGATFTVRFASGGSSRQQAAPTPLIPS